METDTKQRPNESISEWYERLEAGGNFALWNACYAEAVEVVGNPELAEKAAERMHKAARAALVPYGGVE